mgnify:CR=1 FL=1
MEDELVMTVLWSSFRMVSGSSLWDSNSCLHWICLKSKNRAGCSGQFFKPWNQIISKLSFTNNQKIYIVFPHWISIENSIANILRMLARWHLSLLCANKYFRNWYMGIGNIFLSLSSTPNFAPVLPLEVSERQINGSPLVVIFFFLHVWGQKNQNKQTKNPYHTLKATAVIWRMIQAVSVPSASILNSHWNRT